MTEQMTDERALAILDAVIQRSGHVVACDVVQARTHIASRLRSAAEPVAVVEDISYMKRRLEWLGDIPNGEHFLYLAPPPRAEVDEAMVERACAESFGPRWPSSSTHNDGMLREMVRKMLTAALSKPAAEGGEVEDG